MIRPGSFSPFDNIHPGLLAPFAITPCWFAWFLLLIYDSLVPLVPLIIYGSLVPLIISWFLFLLLIYDSLVPLVPLIIYGFVGSFDNILVFFPLIIINLWFVRFFDDSIRVRLVPLIISVLVHLVSLNFNIRPGSLGPFEF